MLEREFVTTLFSSDQDVEKLLILHYKVIVSRRLHMKKSVPYKLNAKKSLIVKFNQDFETTGAFNDVKGDDALKELRL